jgi:hypothetical protein
VDYNVKQNTRLKTALVEKENANIPFTGEARKTTEKLLTPFKGFNQRLAAHSIGVSRS